MSSGSFTVSTVFAVVGASRDTSKYGYKVFLSLKKRGYKVYPINPKTNKLPGDVKCYGSLKDLPEKPEIVVTVVPPKIAMDVIKEAAKLGISKIWMQEGSESEGAIEFCKQKNINCITNTCIIIANENPKGKKDNNKNI